jgi:hypothetical protein
MPDHYRVLGVHPSASSEQIRAAYRDLARRLHPDHQRDASAPEVSLAERRMREINEAWRVLQDPARRRLYDVGREHRPVAPGRPAAGVDRFDADADDDLVDVGPSDMTTRAVHGLPWIVLILVLGFIFVMTAYAGKHDAAPPAVDRVAPVGSCLVVSAGPSTSVVPCDQPNTGRVVDRVDDMSGCPGGTDPRRLAPDGRTDCLAAP